MPPLYKLHILFSHRSCAQLSIHNLNQDRIAHAHTIRENQLRSQCLHMFLQVTFQRPCTVHRIVTIFDNECLGFIGQGNGKFLICQTFIDICNEQVDDSADVALCQRLKQYSLIQSVQELRSEMRTKIMHHCCLCLRADHSVRIDSVKQVLGTDIGS